MQSVARAALKEKYAGRAIVARNFTAQGEVVDIRILQGVCPSIAAVAVAAVRQMKRFRPGRQMTSRRA